MSPNTVIIILNTLDRVSGVSGEKVLSLSPVVAVPDVSNLIR